MRHFISILTIEAVIVAVVTHSMEGSISLRLRKLQEKSKHVILKSSYRTIEIVHTPKVLANSFWSKNRLEKKESLRNTSHVGYHIRR